ncbi:NADH dehydrogenase [ubiquinone] 1 beta subcomplex subunit 9 [Exaiptasia diaphana]|uniref:NADH dehydrogenase [ubiquinone] 1 beta subcomplex subunit 9 n=1 Tax=Exaiptasia diaphana TaxID=2652724 RepID=A0A913WUR6_EXADI|nr:NADH dehydrogenase [ubiquinone] 1 beta subcomplex subunit 9 [Exaiptasia diaphana]XP_020906464.1 NADH dehydrogenase [ubiquinone] 1 beta subcomplex subunit 9 [Exaiptasia diaphana]KXJ10841.1 NADH dehydrogenase [ubiquinone] 1 beta subcomplex subunit 9 [Exaiptasia diaphana]KXJ17672.1 NADH dehydrogenase [ubiquinone] 1 beta subcomplex subunit 9 [Exaiptasia diaphana]
MAYVSTSHLVRGITHQQRVTRLYRNSLKHLLSWCIGREGWRKEALELRARFDANKEETDRKKIAAIMDQAEVEFEQRKHPYPYLGPTVPDGSKWERNTPPAPHVLMMLPQEEEWYKEMMDYANYKTD